MLLDSGRSRKTLHEFTWYLWSFRCTDHWDVLMFICALNRKYSHLSDTHILIVLLSIFLTSLFDNCMISSWKCAHINANKRTLLKLNVEYVTVIDYLHRLHIIHNQCSIKCDTTSRQLIKQQHWHSILYLAMSAKCYFKLLETPCHHNSFNYCCEEWREDCKVHYETFK